MNGLSTQIRVIKIGGSLFNYQHATKKILQWRERQSPKSSLWLAGGGFVVDAVRKSQIAVGVSDGAAHWMSIELLDVTAEILLSWFPKFSWSDQLLPTRVGIEDWILFPGQWLKIVDLPVSWDITSDSIAAKVALSLREQGNEVELILMKSRLPSAGEPFQSTVDAGFMGLARTLETVRQVDIRSQNLDELVLNDRYDSNHSQ